MCVHIFDFLDFRAFLNAAYRQRKAANPIFSHRYIAQKIGASSAGWFSDLVKGRINLSGSHMSALVRLLELDAAETEYFETLVRFDQAGSLEEKNRQYRRLITLKGVKPEMVGKERFEFYSAWYHAVIRELLFFHEFRGDYAALARKLQPPISASQAKKSIHLLKSLGFIHRTASGGYKPESATLKKDPGFKAFHLANYLRANIALGAESLDASSKEERDLSAMTLSLSATAYAQAKQEIKALRERLLALTDLDERPDRVYQFNFHAFPVTKKD